MYGISWGAFNALMLATYRRPPALKALYVLHGSHDLYSLDVHYMDGILHYDRYALSVGKQTTPTLSITSRTHTYIDHENALPRTPKYELDPKWVGDRFNTTPWTQLYLNYQVDSEFWRYHSIKYDWSNIRIPVYLIGGYYDLYTDFAPKIYEAIKDQVPKARVYYLCDSMTHFLPPLPLISKIQMVIGPWDHAWPEQGSPGPNYDGKAEAVRWFMRWLNDVDNSIDEEPDVTYFIRDSYPPNPNISPVPGSWRYDSWPIPSRQSVTFYLTNNQSIVESPRK